LKKLTYYYILPEEKSRIYIENESSVKVRVKRPTLPSGRQVQAEIPVSLGG
jgi:hypothetical protein